MQSSFKKHFQLIVFRKLLGWKTGEVIYEKVYMSPQPPPKISLKHEWKREWSSEHAQRSEVGQLSRSFQSNQPFLNPNRERTGRPVIRDDAWTVQSGSKTSRSQEIEVNSFHEESVSSERTGRPVIGTSVIKAHSSEDSEDLNVEQAHERTRRPVITHDVIHMSDRSQTRSAHESETFNVGDKTLRERMGRPVIDHDNFESWANNGERGEHGLPKSKATTFCCEACADHPDRHALQQALRQNQAYNPFSPESKRMIQDVGDIELVELLETEPKTQCTACLSYWNVGIVYCTCGRFLQKETEINRKYVKFMMGLLSVPEYVIKKGRPHGHRYGKKPRDKEYYLANQLKKKCKKRDFQGIHDRFLRDQEFRIRMFENHRDEDLCRRWDALADEDHTHHLTAQEYFHDKNKWWLHSNKQGSNTMHWGIDLIQSRHCPPCNDCNKKLEKNHTCLLVLTSTKNGRHRVHLPHGGIGKIPGGLLKIQKVKEEVRKVLRMNGETRYW